VKYKISNTGHVGVNLRGQFWTSGSDHKMERNFMWCSSNNSVVGSNILWSVGEPSGINDFGLEEDCVSIHLNTGAPQNNALSDVNCEDSFSFICEVYFCILSSSQVTTI